MNTYHELFQGLFEELVVDSDTAGVFSWRKRVLHDYTLDDVLEDAGTKPKCNDPTKHTIFDEQVDVDLLQGDTHAGTFEIGQHDKFNVCRRLIVVKLILTGGI